MTREELIAESIKREAVGRIAGAILRAALNGASLQRAIQQAAPDKRTGEIAWKEMHSVAHMWAAQVDYPIADSLSVLRGAVAPTDPKPFLRRSEELLDQMQSRPDLAHPEPWCCSNEIRSLLGLPARPWR